MVQTISSWPFDINADYLKVVKPQGLLRTWYTPGQQRPGNEFEFGVELTFEMSGTEVSGKLVGGINTYNESDVLDIHFNELNYAMNDLHSFDFDTLK
jgi:uncharacterized protein YndB with AHSA1/START domain